MTLSIAGRCARTGQFGVAITSSSPAVASRCAYVRAGVGAACTQNITDPRLGPRLLNLMTAGRSAPVAVAELVASEALIDYRQITAVDRAGRTGVHSGPGTLGIHAASEAPDVVAAGNLLAHAGVVEAMTKSFGQSPDVELAARLISALAAGLAAGGEAGPVHSAGVLIAGDVSWPITDLRVDWSDSPVAELQGLWERWSPQAGDYLRRALDPGAAPSYGVPGDPDR
jgi:uncharacterized Ntn-hydrolase superfamily protein